MKHIFIPLFCLCSAFLNAQYNINIVSYALNLSARNTMATSLTIYKDGKMLADKSYIDRSAPDANLYFMSIGILPLGKRTITAKDSLFKIYGPISKGNSVNEMNWGTFSSYDSVRNIFSFGSLNAMYGCNSTYQFDSLGRITSFASSNTSEVAGGGGSSSSIYTYFPEKYQVNMKCRYNLDREIYNDPTSKQPTNMTIEFDPKNGLPIKEVSQQEGSDNVLTWEFFYKNEILEKMIYSAANKTDVLVKEEYTYHFNK